MVNIDLLILIHDLIVKVFGFPDLVRFSWSTARESMLKTNTAVVRWECEDETDPSSRSITEFFGKGQELSGRKRGAYYQHRKMKHVTIRDFE